jgi:TolB protein
MKRHHERRAKPALNRFGCRLIPAVILWLPILGVVAGCGAIDSTAEKIVFRSNRTGNYEIYSINPDGSGLRQLTFNEWNDAEPSLAPDGRIVFHSQREGCASLLYSIELDGSDERLVSDHLARDSHAEWSPDGRRIACQRYVFWGSDEVYVMNRDGTGARNITNSLATDWWPRWSPDGLRIYFSRDFDIYVINVDGTGLTQLTAGADDDEAPSCSPDGTTIVFDRNSRLYLMNADGSNIRQIEYEHTGYYHYDWEPVFSPDGSRIVFVRSASGSSWLMIVDVDGRNLRNLTGIQEGFYNTCPDWKRVNVVPVVTQYPTSPGG